jgi:hypothetical protein
MLKMKFVSKEEYAWWNFDEKFQTKESIVEEITKRHERKEMEINLQKLHVQRKIWKDHNRNAMLDFFCINDDKKSWSWKPSSHKVFAFL